MNVKVKTYKEGELISETSLLPRLVFQFLVARIRATGNISRLDSELKAHKYYKDIEDNNKTVVIENKDTGYKFEIFQTKQASF